MGKQLDGIDIEEDNADKRKKNLIKSKKFKKISKIKKNDTENKEFERRKHLQKIQQQNEKNKYVESKTEIFREVMKESSEISTKNLKNEVIHPNNKSRGQRKREKNKNRLLKMKVFYEK